MSLDLLLEAALFVERQTQGEEPEQEEQVGHVATKLGYSSSGCSLLRRDEAPTASAVSNGYSIEYNAASVIHRSGLPASPSSYAANGSSGARPFTNNSAFYPYQHESRSPSPPLHSNGSLDGGEPYRNDPSYRVDDLASRSHRLEEALLRASRKSPPISTSSGASSFQGGGGGGGSSSTSGRISADELLELKKRSGAGTREVHNKLEKNRRAHLRECFEFLRKQLPTIDDKKLSNLGILKSALRYIQALKRKEREYEHTMERLAREKIAAQQRLAALRKEVPSIPGYSGDAVSLDLTSVVPVVLHSQQVQMNQQNERDSPLTFANVQAHTMREENHFHRLGRRDVDQDSNSGTSTASERGDLSDHEESPFQKRSPPALRDTVEQDVLRPHIKYVRAATTTTTSAPAAYVTMVPTSTTGGVLELDGGPVYHVRHPFTGHHQLQLATPQVIATHHGVQLLTHGSSLKLLTTAQGNAGLRVIGDVSTSLQPLVTVHAASDNGEDSSLLNGTGGATAGTMFCTPSGMVIPSLVALPSAESSSSSTTTPTSYELARNFKHSSSIPNSPTVLSLPNGLLKATVNRTLQPSTTSGVTHVITPIGVTRSLPLVTSMAVMGQPAKHVAHILTNSSLDKMGLLKPGSIPIISSQYLASPAGRHVMKPVMVVAAPPSMSPPTQLVAQRDATATAPQRPSTPQTKYPPT